MKEIKVLIVDDSPVVRGFMENILNQDPTLKVVGTAENPYLAVEKIKQLNPDVLTLDVEMPKMNGLQFLQKLMRGHPMPVVMVSSLTVKGGKTTLKALELGAVDFVAKPELSTREQKKEFKKEVIRKVKAASKVGRRKISRHGSTSDRKKEQLKANNVRNDMAKELVIGIGASTGGVKAIKKLLPMFPKKMPGIIIVQHMPEHFTASFAKELDEISSLRVKEAEKGDQILPGQALVVPGDYHLKIKKKQGGYFPRLSKTNKVHHQRPAVDVTFNSMVDVVGRKAIGILLTGMGSDGAQGLKNIKDAGGHTIAQNEETATIFGMPRRAIELGAAKEVVALKDIPQTMIEFFKRKN